MEENNATCDPQITRLKLYYHQQLQQKEKQICSLISHQKIALHNLRKDIDEIPNFVKTAYYTELVSKLKSLEGQHESVMQEYSKNHVLVSALLYGNTAATSPRPKMIDEQKSHSSSLISSRSKSVSSQEVLTYNNYPSSTSSSNSLLLSVSYSAESSSYVGLNPPPVSNNNSRQTAACNLIKTLPSSSAGRPALKRSLSLSGVDTTPVIRPSGSLPVPSSVPSLAQLPVQSPCGSGPPGSVEFAAANNRPPVQALHPPHAPQQPSSDSAIVLTDDSPSGSSLDSSSTVFLPPPFSSSVSAYGSTHPSSVSSGPSQSHTSNWLVASPSSTTANDVYTPAFDWNSERLPDFSVWS